MHKIKDTSVIAHAGHYHEPQVQAESDDHANHSNDEHATVMATQTSADAETTSNNVMYAGGVIFFVAAILCGIIWIKSNKAKRSK